MPSTDLGKVKPCVKCGAGGSEQEVVYQKEQHNGWAESIPRIVCKVCGNSVCIGSNINVGDYIDKFGEFPPSAWWDQV